MYIHTIFNHTKYIYNAWQIFSGTVIVETEDGEYIEARVGTALNVLRQLEKMGFETAAKGLKHNGKHVMSN